MRTLANLSLLTVLFLACAFAASPEIVVTLNATDHYPVGMDKPPFSRIAHVGIDAHGVMFMTASYPSDPEEVVTRVWLPDGVTSEMFDHRLKSVITGMDWNNWMGFNRNTADVCQGPKGSTEKFIAQELLAGLTTFHYTIALGDTTLDYWFAKDVACFPVKQVSTRADRVEVMLEPISSQKGGASHFTTRPQGYAQVGEFEGQRQQVERIFHVKEAGPDAVPECYRNYLKKLEAQVARKAEAKKAEREKK